MQEYINQPLNSQKYFAHMGELMRVYCEDLGENVLPYNGTAL